ncbi:MAG: hypothetical protein ACW99F_14785 [Candidatus Hodarchaeales archaeon]|jgi:hypothetical protein
MIDNDYIYSAIETLDLVLQIANHLHSTQQTPKMNDFLSQIQTKADSKISSSLGKTLGIELPVDQEGKSPKYWEGVRDMARLSIKKWVGLNDIQKYLAFLTGTKANLAAKVGMTITEENPLDDFVGDAPVQPVAEPANPLEDMLSSSAPVIAPQPTPTPITITPKPQPVTPEPTIPKIPKLEPEPERAIPTPTPVAPTPIPDPVVPSEPSDKLAALDEALQTSGLETPATPQPSPSLSDMLLSKEDSGDKSEEEDDMLSLSLREALKILRDEDED